MGKLKSPKYLLIVGIAMFVCMYMVTSGSYYEYQLRQKTDLTEDAIRQFEIDIKEGKDVDINDYLDNTEKDLNNRMSNFNKNISNKISNAVGNSIKYVFESISKAINN